MNVLYRAETIAANAARGVVLVVRWLWTPRSPTEQTRDQATSDFMDALENYLDSRQDGILQEASKISLKLGAWKLTGPFVRR